MRLGCLNVGGWSLKDPENKPFREQTVTKTNCDIFCVQKHFLKTKEILQIDGYMFISHNRIHLHKRGGCGVFLRSTILNMFTVTVLDDTVEDILWINCPIEKVFSLKISFNALHIPPL